MHIRAPTVRSCFKIIPAIFLSYCTCKTTYSGYFAHSGVLLSKDPPFNFPFHRDQHLRSCCQQIAEISEYFQRNAKAAITAVTNVSHYWLAWRPVTENSVFIPYPQAAWLCAMTTQTDTFLCGIPQPEVCFHASLFVLTVLFLHTPHFMLKWSTVTFLFSFLIWGNCLSRHQMK